MAEAAAEVEVEEDDDELEKALRENAKLKAENVRLKKGKKGGDDDDEVKTAKREATLTGHKVKAAENKKKLKELDPPKQKTSPLTIVGVVILVGLVAWFVVSAGQSSAAQAEQLDGPTSIVIGLAVLFGFFILMKKLGGAKDEKKGGDKKGSDKKGGDGHKP